MKDLLEYILKSITQYPEKVQVTEESLEEDSSVLKIKAAKEDMGLIIGKEGRVIRAIRNLVRLKAFRERKKVHVELVE